MDADGSNRVRLTHNEIAEFGGAWSPDGTRIAYFVNAPDRNGIYLMDARDGFDALPLARPEQNK